MKKLFAFFIAIFVSMSIVPIAYARDTQYILPIAEVMKADVAKQKLNRSIKIYFGSQRYPHVIQTYGSFVSNRKTNAFAKNDVTACNWAFLSAILALQNRARVLGGNAVVNVVSYYNKNQLKHPEGFECHAGAIVAGVTMKGDVVRIADMYSTDKKK